MLRMSGRARATQDLAIRVVAVCLIAGGGGTLACGSAENPPPLLDVGEERSAGGAAGGSSAESSSGGTLFVNAGGARGGREASGGTAAAPTGTGGASASGGARSLPEAGTPAEGGVMPDAGEPPPSTGSLPPVTALDEPGPFTAQRRQATGPSSAYQLFHPSPLAGTTARFPLVVFGPGSLGTCTLYLTLLQHIASHGFVVGCYNAAASGPSLKAGVDWLVQEASRGTIAGPLDPAHIALVGQSTGSHGVFAAAVDPRITTTVHLQGGTNAPHTAVNNLHAPAQFLCGESPPPGGDGTFVYDVANPNCALDFDAAPVPVFYGSLRAGSHTQVVDIPTQPINADSLAKRKAYFGAITGWLRWHLAGDDSQRALFVGPGCTLCQPGSRWTVRQRDLEKLP